VKSSLGQADDFTRPFQEMMTERCWAFGWDDAAIAPKTRSLMSLASAKMQSLIGRAQSGLIRNASAPLQSCWSASTVRWWIS